jgi:signal transduction histidine kinase/tetratricopeptide (TPR) repeat protein
MALMASSFVMGQGNNSQEQAIQESNEIFELAFEDAQLAKGKAKKLLQRAKKNQDVLLQAHALNSLGWSYFHIGALDSALTYLEESKALFKTENKNKETIQVSLNLGEVYTRKNNFKRALIHLTEADELNEKTQNLELQTDLYRQFGIVYRELKKYDQSAEYFKKAMDGFEQQKDMYRYVTTGLSLSILYRKIGKQKEALKLLETLEKVHEEHKLSTYLLAMIEENLGETYFETEAYTKALGHFREALELFESLSFAGDIAYEAMNLGKTYSQLSQWLEAEKYLLQSVRISDSLDMKNYSLDASLELAALYEKQSRWSDAYQYAQKARALSDSLNIQEQILSTQELAEKFENDKKEQEIELLQTQKELAESKRKRTRIALLLSSFLALGAIIIAWLFWNKIKLNKKLEFEKQQNKIAGDIEDERILNQFAISLFGKNTIEDILWDVAQNCIKLLHFEDCVIYVADLEKQVLIQYAAAGPKNPIEQREIFNPIQIPFNQGIVGSVYQHGKAEIVTNTALDARYIVDDEARLSELTVPIFIDGKVYGIIDSENHTANFYTERHLSVLQRVASICSERITKLLTEQRMRHSIARDLHDEVGSTITSINILSNIVQHEALDKQKAHLQQINEQSAKIMESMSDIIWAINPNHDTIEQIILKMKEFAIELLESAGIQCVFNTEVISSQQNILPEERKYIFLIFKEAVNNAVKYSEAQEIQISVALSQEKFQFTISDNGLGFDLSLKKSGNGLTNMHERAKIIHASLEIISQKNQGTRIRLIKPLSHDLGSIEHLDKP